MFIAALTYATEKHKDTCIVSVFVFDMNPVFSRAVFMYTERAIIMNGALAVALRSCFCSATLAYM